MATSTTDSSAGELLLVTGAARSGTSSLAGSLFHLGWHVPPPVVQPAERNQKGHFEPLWTIKWHKRHLAAAGLGPTDTLPEAPQVMEEYLADSQAERELTEWIGKRKRRKILVKDPHAPLFLPLWQRAAEAAGRRITVLVIVRPAPQVVASRERTWGQNRTEDRRAVVETRNAAQWLNALFTVERLTPTVPRAFVRYPDLLADWRATLGRASEQLDLGLDTSPAPHELDTWLDPDMQRVEASWEGLHTAPWVRDMCDRGWQQVDALVQDPRDPVVSRTIQEMRDAYGEQYHIARSVVDDEFEHLTAKHRGEMKRMRKQLESLQRQGESTS